MSEVGTKYILEYCYDGDGWREDAVFNSTVDAHHAFTDHVKEFPHITARVRKVRYITEEDIVANFQPISSEEYDNE